MNMQIDIAADRRSVTVAGHRLEAVHLDELIRRLADARARLEPAVPFKWPAGTNPDATNNPSIKLTVTQDETLMLSFRHQGFGWVTFDFDMELAERLRLAMGRRIDALDVVDIQDLPDGDGPKH